MIFRNISYADCEIISRINDAAYPAVPYTSAAEFWELINYTDLAVLAEEEDTSTIVGFIIALPSGSTKHKGEVYHWYSKEHDNFYYVDRIIISSEAQSKGIGPRLYDIVFKRAKELNTQHVLVEIYADPPNPRSMKFHTRLGFEFIDSLWEKNNTVLSNIYVKTL